MWMAVSVWQGCGGCTLIPLNLSGQLKSSSHVNRAPGGTLLLQKQQVEGTFGVHTCTPTHRLTHTVHCTTLVLQQLTILPLAKVR